MTVIHAFGQSAERLACDYLTQKGLTLIEKNFACQCGEIDLIMQDKNNTYVFIEVRARNQKSLLDVLDSITPRKQQKIVKAATIYLQKSQLMNKVYCRFDAIAVHSSGNDFKIDWIKNAFEGYCSW